MLKTQALILKSQNWKETDRMITFLCPELGKKRAIVRGARKPLSKLASHLDVLMVSSLVLTEGNLPVITSAFALKSYRAIRSSYEKTERAMAVVKLSERMALEEVDQRQLFHLTLNVLELINKDKPWSNVWLYFLFGLNDFLGLTSLSVNCFNCRQPFFGQGWWNEEERRFQCRQCLKDGTKTVRVQLSTRKLFAYVSNQPIISILKVKIPSRIALETEQILLKSITQWLNKPWQYYAQLDRN